MDGKRRERGGGRRRRRRREVDEDETKIWISGMREGGGGEEVDKNTDGKVNDYRERKGGRSRKWMKMGHRIA